MIQSRPIARSQRGPGCSKTGKRIAAPRRARRKNAISSLVSRQSLHPLSSRHNASHRRRCSGVHVPSVVQPYHRFGSTFAVIGSQRSAQCRRGQVSRRNTRGTANEVVGASVAKRNFEYVGLRFSNWIAGDRPGSDEPGSNSFTGDSVIRRRVIGSAIRVGTSSSELGGVSVTDNSRSRYANVNAAARDGSAYGSTAGCNSCRRTITSAAGRSS